MPVILGIELGDWLLAGGVGWLAANASGAVEGTTEGVAAGVQGATSNLLTIAMIGGAAALLYVLLRKG